MALVTSRSSLNQGSSTAVPDAIFATGTGADIRIHTGTNNNLPALAVDEFFEVRDHTNAQNNGLYQVVTVTTSTDDYEVNKVNGSAPIVASVEAITTLGATGAATEKSVFFDTAGLGVYVLEQGNVSSDGVVGQAIYSFMMQEWKDDNVLIKAGALPMLTIDSDAGKYIIGQDASGNNSGWNWVDDWAGFSIRTRKLLRNMGWDEVDANGNTIAREVGIVTLGVFADAVNHIAYYSFGSDTTVDNTTDFDFAGPVNEAVRFFEEQAQTDLAITATTITRVGGSFIDEGYKVGGQVTIRNAEDSGNNGTFILTDVAALVLTTTGLTINADDTAAILAVDNDNSITLGLRVRDAAGNGQTFSQATLTTINKTILGNFVYSFPLANAEDLKIVALDAAMAGVPYSGMSITYHTTGQSRSGLVGGSFNFSIIVEGNNGTSQQVYEFLQYSLRQTTDIDADGDVAIGRAMDLLARFNGEVLEVGSADGGLNFPYNPDSDADGGVYVDNINSASANFIKFWDDTGTLRANPETIAVTLDFNQTAIDDVQTEYDLFYDRTIRTALTDLIITAGSPATFGSVLGGLPDNTELAVGSYVRVEGLTGADEAMNGVYQVTVETTPGTTWSVVRYDGVTIVTTTDGTVNIDQNSWHTPDAILVHTNVVNVESGSTITYTSPDTISDSANGFGNFASGDLIEIEGSTSNDGIYEIDTAAVGSLTLIEQTLTTEASSTASVITKIVSGLADADETFNYDFDGNTQGGRTVSTDTFVKAKAVGFSSAQYTESTVQTIESGTPLTIPLVAQTERNTA